jgi:hypothetical protein
MSSCSTTKVPDGAKPSSRTGPPGLANISQGLEECLFMGNIDALRDWGHAKDYVRMQWLMLQQDKPEDRHCDCHWRAVQSAPAHRKDHCCLWNANPLARQRR